MLPKVPPPGRRAFSLVELLIVCSMITLVMGTTTAVIAGGFRVWERLRTHGDVAQQVMVGLAKVRKDIRSATRFAQLPFEGKYDQFSVTGRVPIQGADMDEIARITYKMDDSAHVLCRSVIPPRDPAPARRRGCSAVLSGVKRLRFNYLGEDPESGTIRWLTRWSSAEPPMAVRMELQLQELEESADIPARFVFGIPIAQTKRWQVEEEGAAGE